MRGDESCSELVTSLFDQSSPGSDAYDVPGYSRDNFPVSLSLLV